MEQKRTFNSDHIYSEEEIRSACPEASMEDGEYENKTKYEYLVAPAEVEYWFKREGTGWKVDHTWGSFILTPKETTAD